MFRDTLQSAPEAAQTPANAAGGSAGPEASQPGNAVAGKFTSPERLTGVCKNQIIATNRPTASGFRPTPE